MAGTAFDQLALSKPSAKYAALKALRLERERDPQSLHPRSFSVPLERHAIVGNLTAADPAHRIDAILDEYLAPIRSPRLVDAANPSRARPQSHWRALTSHRCFRF